MMLVYACEQGAEEARRMSTESGFIPMSQARVHAAFTAFRCLLRGPTFSCN